MILPLTIGVLVAGGVYLMLQRNMVRIVFGLTLLSHAANLLLLSSGVLSQRGEPLIGSTPLENSGDPLPMAFVLTAIVITLAVTILMLMFSVVGRDDDTADEKEVGEG